MRTSVNLLLTSWVFLGLSHTALSAKSLIEIDASFDTSSIIDCLDPSFVSCQKATIDFDALRSGHNLDFLGKAILPRINEFPSAIGNMVNFVYQDDFGTNSAVLTFDNSTESDALEGVLVFQGEDHGYALENCGDDCHVLIKQGNETDIDNPEALDRLMSRAIPVNEEEQKAMEAESRQADNGQRVTISIALYYTSRFRSVTSNVNLKINNELANLQAGYDTTDIPITFRAHCVSELDMAEPRTTDEILDNFERSRGSVRNLLNSADIAILLTSRAAVDSCGAAYLRPTYTNAPPIAYVGKDCNSETFAHEVGHLLGARHNREISNTNFPDDNFGFGYLIRGTTMATIMAYRSGSFTDRLKAFSSPEYYVTRNGQRIYIGTSSSDARRTVMLNRIPVSRIGDESNSNCGSDGGSSECSDNYSSCPGWRNRGYCSRSSRYHLWMIENCQESCDTCDGGGASNANCVDQNSNCARWAQLGFCTGRYETFMTANCARSCGLLC